MPKKNVNFSVCSNFLHIETFPPCGEQRNSCNLQGSDGSYNTQGSRIPGSYKIYKAPPQSYTSRSNCRSEEAPDKLSSPFNLKTSMFHEARLVQSIFVVCSLPLTRKVAKHWFSVLATCCCVSVHPFFIFVTFLKRKKIAFRFQRL